MGYAEHSGNNLKLANSHKRPTMTQRREHRSETLWHGAAIGFFANLKYCRVEATNTLGKATQRTSPKRSIGPDAMSAAIAAAPE